MDMTKTGFAIIGIILLFCAGCVDERGTGTDTPVPSSTTIKVKTPAVPVHTTVMTVSETATAFLEDTTVAATPDTRFRNPLKLKQAFLFGNETRWNTEIAVQRIWITDSYRWYNPEELQYDTRTAPEGKKYLFVFLSLVNHGSERAPLPASGNIHVMYDYALFSPFASHPLPMQNPDSTPRIARIAEIEYSRKVYSSELVEDYGYSHGQRLGYVTPGESNAVEGYIIYEVPASLTPESAYVLAILPDKTETVWVLG